MVLEQNENLEIEWKRHYFEYTEFCFIFLFLFHSFGLWIITVNRFFEKMEIQKRLFWCWFVAFTKKNNH
jgi:hypothetical protein